MWCEYIPAKSMEKKYLFMKRRNHHILAGVLALLMLITSIGAIPVKAEEGTVSTETGTGDAAQEQQSSGDDTGGGSAGGGTGSSFSADPVIYVAELEQESTETSAEIAAVTRVSRNIAAGQTGKLPNYVDEEEITVTYQSSDESIAEVSDKGTITAKKAGKAEISITVTGPGAAAKTILALNVVEKDKVPVSVRNFGKVFMTENGTPVTELTKTVKAGETSSVKTSAGDETQVTYQSKNSEIASVSPEGTITGIKKGTVNIVASVKTKDAVMKYRIKTSVRQG